MVLFEDSAAMPGLVGALSGVLLSHTTGILIFDGIASIIIGLILIGTSVGLAYETKGLLIGESASQAVRRGIRDSLRGRAHIDHVNEILTMHMGPDFILANISVDFDNSISAQQVESDIAAITRSIKQAYPQIKRVFIEAETLGNRYPPGYYLSLIHT